MQKGFFLPDLHESACAGFEAAVLDLVDLAHAGDAGCAGMGLRLGCLLCCGLGHFGTFESVEIEKVRKGRVNNRSESVFIERFFFFFFLFFCLFFFF